MIEFAAMIVAVVECLPNSKAGNHISNQLIRSGTSPAPNYAEAQSAESRKGPPFDLESAEVMAAVETGAVEGYLCATTITTIHYLLAKDSGISIHMPGDMLAILEG